MTEEYAYNKIKEKAPWLEFSIVSMPDTLRGQFVLKDAYGEFYMNGLANLSRRNPNKTFILSAVNKEKYIEDYLKLNNEYLNSILFEVLDYNNSRDVVFKCKYGVIKSGVSNLKGTKSIDKLFAFQKTLKTNSAEVPVKDHVPTKIFIEECKNKNPDLFDRFSIEPVTIFKGYNCSMFFKDQYGEFKLKNPSFLEVKRPIFGFLKVAVDKNRYVLNEIKDILTDCVIDEDINYVGGSTIVRYFQDGIEIERTIQSIKLYGKYSKEHLHTISEKDYIEYNEVKKLTQEKGITSRERYWELCDNSPNLKLSKYPENYYKEWINWDTFYGNDYISSFVPLEVFNRFCRIKGITKSTQWCEFYKENKKFCRKKGLPYQPNKVYSKEFTWYDFENEDSCIEVTERRFIYNRESIDCVIYKATHIETQKPYIGQTINGLEKRRNSHENSYKTYFNKAIQKYGKDSFEWDVLEKIETPESYREAVKILNKLESEYIEKYDSFKNGFNSRRQ